MDGKKAIAKILKLKALVSLPAFPTTRSLMPSLQKASGRSRPGRSGLLVGIADGFTRATFGRRNGVCLVQAGPGSESQFAGVAQAFSDSVPILLLPSGNPRRELKRPQFVAMNNYRAITKWVDMAYFADQVPTLMRRAFVSLRTGRPGPVMLEIPRMLLRSSLMTRSFSMDRSRAGGRPETLLTLNGWRLPWLPPGTRLSAPATACSMPGPGMNCVSLPSSCRFPSLPPCRVRVPFRKTTPSLSARAPDPHQDGCALSQEGRCHLCHRLKLHQGTLHDESA